MRRPTLFRWANSFLTTFLLSKQYPILPDAFFSEQIGRRMLFNSIPTKISRISSVWGSSTALKNDDEGSDRSSAIGTREETFTPQMISNHVTNPVHHVALQTNNITRAIMFYSLLGFECVEKFRAGPAKASWLQFKTPNMTNTLIELLEVPSTSNIPRRAPGRLDPATSIMGYHHVALQVSLPLETFVAHLNTTSYRRFGKYLYMAVWPPQQRQMGSSGVYDVAFVYDADGCLIELLYHQPPPPKTHSSLLNATNSTTVGTPGQIMSGWEPWNGTGWVGGTN